MSTMANYLMERVSTLTTMLLVCVLLVALFMCINKIRKLTSKVCAAIVNELKIGKLGAIWYCQTLFMDDQEKFKRFVDVLNHLQPTPYEVKSLLFPIVYVDHPEDLQIVLNDANALEKSYVYKFGDCLLERSLLTTTVPSWKLLRRAMTPMFNSYHLEKYSHVMNKWSKQIVRELQTLVDTGETFDLWDSIALVNLNTISETLMGIDPNIAFTNVDRHKQTRNVEKLSSYMLRRIEHVWLHLNIISNIVDRFQNIFQWVNETKEFGSKAIRHRRKILTEGASEGGEDEVETALLDIMCTLHPSVEGEEISEFLKNEVFILYSAGYETSALNICFTLLMLAMNPLVQNELFKEIIQSLGNTDDQLISVDDVGNLHLLDRCIKESLRLYSALPIIAREATAKIQLTNGKIIQKGTNIVISPYQLHRNPQFYENPMVWDPDHFLPEAVQKRHPYSFIPFSAGPRGCIGAKYGMLSMKILLATILRKYRFTTDMTMNDVKHDFDIVLRSSNGWKVKLHSRCSTS